MTFSIPPVLSAQDYHGLSTSDRHVFLIDLVYRLCLGRSPEPDMLAARAAGLDDGIPFADMLVEIATSAEGLANATGRDLGDKCSDGEFLMIVGKLLNGRGLVPAEIASGERFLDEDPLLRAVYVKSFLKDYIADKLDPKTSGSDEHDAGKCLILGTKRILTRQLWDERAATLPRRPGARRPGPRTAPRPPTGEPKVSMIASLYRGGKFIEPFLRNITAQTLFDKSELIIVDAASPDGEHELIADYQKMYSNIVYKRINYRIGIYDAWNLGVQLSRGAYLTNTNLDDLRRDDSIALQADLLDREADLDVVYQDFFYSFDSDLDFDEVAGLRLQERVADHHASQPACVQLASQRADVAEIAARRPRAVRHELSVSRRLRILAPLHGQWQEIRQDQHPARRLLPEPGGDLDPPGYARPGGILPDPEPLLGAGHVSDAAAVAERLLRKPRDRPCARCSRRAPTSLRRDPGRVAAMRQQSFRRAPDRRHRRQRRHARSRQTMRLLVDGVFFQLAQTGIGRVWVTLLSKLARVPDLEIILLDRGRCPEIDGVARVPFPAYTMTYTAADSLLIQKVCDDLAIDVFSSTYYTSPLTTPQVQMVYDMIPEVMEFDLSARAWKEKQLALSYASHFACISANTRHDLLHFYPGIAPRACGRDPLRG